MNGPTLREFFPEVLRRREASGGRDLKSFASCWKVHIGPAPISSRPLAEITRADVATFLRELAEKPVLPAGYGRPFTRERVEFSAEQRALVDALPERSRPWGGRTWPLRARYLVCAETGLPVEEVGRLRVPQNFVRGGRVLDDGRAGLVLDDGREVALSAGTLAELDAVSPDDEGLIFGAHRFHKTVRNAARALGLPASVASSLQRFDYRSEAPRLSEAPCAAAPAPGRLKRTSLRRVFCVLRAVLQQAEDDGLIAEDPSAGLRRARSKERAPKRIPLGAAGQAQLLAAFRKPIVHVVECALYMAIRSGELFSLTLDDVDLSATPPRMTVRFGSWDEQKGFLPTKNGEERTVPLLPQAVVALRAWLAQLSTHAPHNPLRLVFPSSAGTYWYNAFKCSQWRRGVVRADLGTRMRFHDLRHEGLSSLISGTWGPAWRMEDVRIFAGHLNLKVTQHYAQTESARLDALVLQMQPSPVDVATFAAVAPPTPLPAARAAAEFIRAHAARAPEATLAPLRSALAGAVLADPLVRLAEAVRCGSLDADRCALELAAELLERTAATKK